MSLHNVLEFFYSQLFITPPYPTHSFAHETVIVTGSNTGLGKEAARHVARLGARKLILAVRNVSAGEEAKLDIETTTKCALNTIEVWPLDLSSYASVKTFAKRAAGLDRLDVLLNNAAFGIHDKWHVAEGHELSITVNVISTFLLVILFLPKLKETALTLGVHPRVTVVVSGAQAVSAFKEKSEPDIFAALDDKDKADLGDRYPVSKLLETLLVRELAPRLQGSGLVLNMTAPGFCRSELSRETEGSVTGTVIKVSRVLLARSTEKGSRSLVAAISAGPESHGKYFDDGAVKEHRLGAFVKSDAGMAAGAEVWKQLSVILDEVAHGVSKNVDT